MAHHIVLWLVDELFLLDQLTEYKAVFNVTKLLLFRPFLLLCLELKRRGVRDIRRERNGGVEMKVIYEAAACSVSSAQNIINLCDSLFSLKIGIEVSIVVASEPESLHQAHRYRACIAMASTSRAHVSSLRSQLSTKAINFLLIASRSCTLGYDCCDSWDHTNLYEARALLSSR